MLTKRENFLETIHGGNPDRFVNQYEAIELVMNPILTACPQPGPGDPPAKDNFGVTFQWPADQPGAFPDHSPDKIVITDMEHWRDQVITPQVEFPDEAWAPFVAQAQAVDRSEQFVAAFIVPGLFERCHHLMSISEALVNFYMYPDEMHELIDWVTDYEMAMAEQICEHLHPDALFHHDDWGSYDSTFLSPEMFDEFFLEPYQKIYGYYKDHGVELVIHHSDSYAATLVPSMIEMGIDVWQGAMLSNDIPTLIEKYGGQISFMGGLDNAIIDKADWTREKIDDLVEKVCRECGAYYFIPNLPTGLPNSVIPEVYGETSKSIAAFSEKAFDEILAQTKEKFGK